MYFDGPVLFLAQDLLGTKYLCQLINRSGQYDEFLTIALSPERLNLLFSGECDLRTLFEEPELGEYYLLRTNSYGTESLTIDSIAKEAVTESWLPDHGIIINSFTNKKDKQLLHDSLLQNTAVIHLDFNPPEAIRDHAISTIKLAQGLLIFQNLLKFSYKKAIKDLTDKKLKKQLDTPENYQTDVYAFAPASFEVHLRAKMFVDAFGYVDISRALNKLDAILELVDNPEQSLSVLKENRGHFFSNYLKLLEFIISNNSPISYSWINPQSKKIVSHSIQRSRAIPLYDKLQTIREYEIENVNLEGKIIKINIKSGYWTLQTNEDNKYFSGCLLPDTVVDLNGITVGSKNYIFHCIEKLEETEVTGETKTKYYLKDYD